MLKQIKKNVDKEKKYKTNTQVACIDIVRFNLIH